RIKLTVASPISSKTMSAKMVASRVLVSQLRPGQIGSPGSTTAGLTGLKMPPAMKPKKMPKRIRAITIQRLKPILRVGVVVSVTAHCLLAARLAARGFHRADGAQRHAIDDIERNWETAEYQNNREDGPGVEH